MVRATTTGFFGSIFVLPFTQVPRDGAQVARYFHPNFVQYHERFRWKGTLAGWQELMELCRGKPRLITGVALSFAGPVSAELGFEPPGAQFVGAGGSGRTGVRAIAVTPSESAK